MFFDWKIQLEKVQLTRDLKDDTKIYQGNKPLKKRQRILQPYYKHTSINCLVLRRNLYHISSSKNTR